MNVLNVVPMRSAPPPPASQPHVSVLRAEVLASLDPSEGKLFVDATLGAGGHTEALLRVSGTRVIGIDRDTSALALASERLTPFGSRFQQAHGEFAAIGEVLAARGIERVDGILADIGVSSMQFDDAERGMSFRHEGALDMRMDQSDGLTALELIEQCTDDELANLIYRYGEERRSRRIARCIRQAFAAGELATTLDLRRAVVRAVGPAKVGGVDPATRTFQALRIAVNGELDQLSSLLEQAQSLLNPGGILCVISFHSLEDRLVKRAFQQRDIWAPLTKKPVMADESETLINPRARSAKLRAARLRFEGDDE